MTIFRRLSGLQQRLKRRGGMARTGHGLARHGQPFGQDHGTRQGGWHGLLAIRDAGELTDCKQSVPPALRKPSFCAKQLAALLLVLGAMAMLAGCDGHREAFEGRIWLRKLQAIEADPKSPDTSGEAYRLARAAVAAADRLDGYTAIFEKQERIGGKLRPLETVETVVREDPLSVLMTWTGDVDAGKQALYVEDENDDRVRVYAGHLPAPFTVNVEPDGTLAMKNCLQPITSMGLATLSRGVLQHRSEPRPAPLAGFHLLGRITFDGRTLLLVGRTIIADGDAPTDTLLYGLDARTHLAVMLVRYGPPAERTACTHCPSGTRWHGPQRLLALYRYRCINLDANLPDDQFDPVRLGQ
jgi:Protein of unknown function (DUF1571)